MTVAHSSTVTPVLAWITAQALTPTLGLMRTLHVVSALEMDDSDSVSSKMDGVFISLFSNILLFLINIPHKHSSTHTHTVCSITCDPGFAVNTSNCSCELTDVCEAAGQPCQNGGTCISDLSAPAVGPYYTCTCANGFSGQNCTG